MKIISVYLSDNMEVYLKEIMERNKCSISDAVSMGLLLLLNEPPIQLMKEKRLVDVVEEQLQLLLRKSLNEYCESIAVKRSDVVNLCRRIEQGSTVYGFGDSNKWRDKQDGRTFRTNTAYIAHCIKRDTGLDIELTDVPREG